MEENKDFKIKLIFPCHLEGYKVYWGGYPGWVLPYGMGILAAFLRKNGYYVEQEDLSVKINRYNYSSSVPSYLPKNFSILDDRIDFLLRPSGINDRISHYADKILDSMQIKRFNLIGFSIFSHYYFYFALMLSKRIKEKINIPIVWGGPFINLFGKLYPEAFNFVDYMVAGDGNISLLKLIHYLEGRINISEVPNLSYRSSGDVVTNHQAAQPLADMPMPDFSDLPFKLYDSFHDPSLLRTDTRLPYQVSRGCTNRCSFCNFIDNSKKLEFKSYEKVVTELRQMKERYNNKRFYFCDEAINNSYEYLGGLCDVLIRNRLNIDWIVYAKIIGLDRHILEKMKKAGCSRLILGIESGSDRILKMMNKGFTSEQASKVLRWSSEAGIKNMAYFMAGYPYETQEDVNLTSKFIRENKKYYHATHISVFVLTHASDIYRNFEKYGLTNLSPTPDRFILTFDESGGLKWEQKQKQQAYNRKQIVKTIRTCCPFSLPRMCLKIFVRSIINRISRL